MDYRYVMLITYNFDTEYVSVPCKTEEEAIQKMNQSLKEEIWIIKGGYGYTPVVKRYSDTEVEIFYVDDADNIKAGTDIATFKVIEISHCVDKKDDTAKSWIIGTGGNEMDGVYLNRVTGTKHEIKKYLAKAARDARNADRGSFDYGYTSIGDIEERADGSLYACACFRDYHLDFQAYPEDGIPEEDA